VVFAVSCYQQIIPYSDFKELFLVLIPISAAILLAQIAFSWLIRQPQKPAIATSLSVIFICFFGDLKGRCETWFAGTRWGSLAVVLFAAGTVYLLILWRLARIRRNLVSLDRYLTLVSIALAIGSVPGLWHPPEKSAFPANPRAHTPLRLGPNPPDIYYILTDSRTSPESLKTYWNYDDSAFVNFLTRQGFRVLENARGNFISTPACLATYLNMDYPPVQLAGLSPLARVAAYGEIINQAEAPSRLKASGYDVTVLSIFDTIGQPRHYSYPEISVSTLGSVLWNNTAFGYIHGALLRHSFADINLGILHSLPELAARKSAHPKFVYAHVIMPHLPYLFDREGHRIPPIFHHGVSQEQLYLGQLIYLDTLLTNVISGILKNSPTPPVIILQGDHGYRYLPGPQQQDEAPTILNALYLPGSKGEGLPYPGMTPVNTFRIIFDRYFGEHYACLPDVTTATASTPLSH
jgi:hypothetical protein